LDTSDSQLSNDELLDEIDEKDDIFMFRKKKGKAREKLMNESESDESMDGDNSSHGSKPEDTREEDIPESQRDAENAKDVDMVMNEREEASDSSESSDDEEVEKTVKANQETKEWKDDDIHLQQMEKEINQKMLTGGNSKQQRMLKLASKFYPKSNPNKKKK